jgi:hypothetical protein
MFPADTAQMSAQFDLSAEIPAPNAGSFNLSIVKLVDTEYVLLFSCDMFDTTKTHIFVLSPALQVLSRYSMDYVMNPANFSNAGIPFKGNAAVARPADNQIVIGNLRMMRAADGLRPVDKLPSGQLSQFAIAGPAPGNFLWTNFRDDSFGNLFYDAYNASWSGPTFLGHPIGKTLRVAGAFTYPEDIANNTALLVFSDDRANAQYFVQVPKDPDLAGGWPAASLLANTQYPSFTKQELDTRSIAVTKTGIVAYDYSRRSWTRFLPTAPDSVTELQAGRRSNSPLSAFSYSGGYFCTFDLASRVLTRYEDWW